MKIIMNVAIIIIKEKNKSTLQIMQIYKKKMQMLDDRKRLKQKAQTRRFKECPNNREP